MVTETNTQIAPAPLATLTVRDVLRQLADCTDMDAEVCFTFHGSDPIPVVSFEENEEGQVVLASG